MKAASNGVLNCTVLDGWTYEVDWKNIGWTLDPKNIAESFYDILEKEIASFIFSEKPARHSSRVVGKNEKVNRIFQKISRPKECLKITKNFYTLIYIVLNLRFYFQNTKLRK